MKKTFSISIATILLTLITLVLLTGVISCFLPRDTAFADSEKDRGNIVMTAEKEGKDVTVTVVLTQNKGISALNLQLVYNKEYLTLTDVKIGSALSKLGCTTTNVNTEEGYSITPFKFIYASNTNDTSTGTMFLLHFRIKEGKKNVITPIGLKYTPDNDLHYYNSSSQLVAGNIDITTTSVNTTNTNLIIGLSVGGVAVVIVATIVIIILVKKRRMPK